MEVDENDVSQSDETGENGDTKNIVGTPEVQSDLILDNEKRNDQLVITEITPDTQEDCCGIKEKFDDIEDNETCDPTTEFIYPKYEIKPNNIVKVGHIDYLCDESQPYIKGALWSPDGTCLLYAVRGLGMKIVELPPDLYSGETISKSRSSTSLTPVVMIPENGNVYDFCWYPNMKSTDPATCCWLTSCIHAPVQLWDAFTGELRCSYRGYDQVDELEAAYSVAFSVDGLKIYAGYKKSVKVFETNKPGREYIEYKIKNPVSCIATCPAIPNQAALGSWHRNITLVNDQDDVVREISNITGHFGGITYLKYSPDGLRLYSGARKDNELVCWDLRHLGKPLFSINRLSFTTQRIYLDVSSCGKWLVSGGTDGNVLVWDVEDLSSINDLKLPLHKDCVSSVSIHPYRPIIATGSGQHHYFSNLCDEDINDEEIHPKPIENSIGIWWFGNIE